MTRSHKANLDPLEITLRPCSFHLLVHLPCFQDMKRSPISRQVLTKVFPNEADFFANFHIIAWPSPTNMHPNSYHLVVVPAPPPDVASSAIIDPSRVPGARRGEVALASIDTETLTLMVRVPVAVFDAGKRKAGASVGAPPTGPSHPPPPPGRPAWKYSLLARNWVQWDVPAPTLSMLRAAYPSLCNWVQW